MPLFSPKAKHLPNLAEFLGHIIEKDRRKGTRLGIAGGVIGFLGGMSGLVAGLLGSNHVLHYSYAVTVSLILGINAAAWTVFLVYWLKLRQRERQKAVHPTHSKALRLASEMLKSRRLHREIDEPAAQLLEGSARFWNDIRRQLDGPFWQIEDLPSHWESIRETTLAASDQAMEEQIVVLSDCFHPAGNKAGIQEVMEDVVEKYFTGPQLNGSRHLPVGFEHARSIAEKLKITAAEIERASQQISKELIVQQEFRSSDALDLAIGDLRALQEAETELHQSVNG